MNARNTMIECLISSRNILLGGRCNESVEPCLSSILKNLDLISLASTRAIVKMCIPEVIIQIRNSDFVSAGLILNLIHNLPFDEKSKKTWDIDYFLSMELPTFLERFDEIKSARKIALCILGQISISNQEEGSYHERKQSMK